MQQKNEYTEKLAEILSRPRQCAADWLTIQARDLAVLARATQNPSLLVFACLEARNAIEQLWYELVMLIHGGTIARELYEKCRKRRDGFLAAIREAEPRYRQLSKFTALCMHLDARAPSEGIAWDLGRLKNEWQSLSSYCHAPGHPISTIENPQWFSKGVALVHGVFDYFQQEMSRGASALLKPANMTPEAHMIWEDFAENRITEDQALIRLKIVQPLRQV